MIIKLAIILFSIYNVNAKLRYLNKGFYNEGNQMSRIFAPKENGFAISVGSGDLWSIRFDDDLDFVKLRRANARQEQEFDVVVPKVDFLQQLPPQNENAEQDNYEESNTTVAEVRALQEKILQKINKFGIAVRHGSDSFLAENLQDGGPDASIFILQIFFHKDHRTLIVVTSESKVWFYTMKPPNRFPDWFYKPHTDAFIGEGNEMYVEIPLAIQAKFYETLEDVLRIN